MTTANITRQRAFAIWWAELNRWSPASQRTAAWQWPPAAIKPLATALERRREPVDKKTLELQPKHFVSLRFSGEIEPRDLHGKVDFKGPLFFAHAGDIIYSKIDVRNGAIGIIPQDVPIATVTNEFPVYRIKENAALPEYIQLVFRTEHFRRIVNGMVSGASGRKRVEPSSLEEVEIPIPPIEEQTAIVARHHKAQAEIAAAEERVGKLKVATDARFFADLGLKSPGAISMRKVFAVRWADLGRWGAGFNFLNQSGADLTRGKYPVVALGSILGMVQYGTSEKANSNGDGVPIIRMNNIVNGELDLTHLKHIRLANTEVEKLRLQDGDILFNRTNSKELVGKCAVFHTTGEFVFASYLIRVRARPAQADPDFLAYVINSPVGREQINALSRQIIGQANVNSEELRSLQIPLPPLTVQKQIMRRVAAGREEIARERESAERLAKEITRDVEKLILGTGASK